MIEKYTDEEIKILKKEIAAYEKEQKSNKEKLLKEELKKLGYENILVDQYIRNAMYLIADCLTDNFERKNGREYRGKIVKKEIMDTYCKILNSLLVAIIPYSGLNS